MRLIDADDLIIKLRDWYTQELHSVHISTSGREPSGEDLEECFIEGVLIAIKDFVDQMPTITPEVGWIPRKERCPDENNWFLVTLADGRCTPRFYYGDGWDEDHKGRDVIAWLPNPEPYKRNHRENRKA